MKTVAIESPFAGDEARNLEYLKRCVADCLAKKESPYASHAFFPQFLNDNLQSERKLGIEAGFDWSDKADRIAFYVDYGMSIGMIGALQHYVSKGITNYEFRYIGTNESVAPKLPKPEYPHWRGGDNVKTPEEQQYEAQLTPDTMMGA